MNTVMKHQIVAGIKDTRFQLLALLILFLFIINGLFYSDYYHQSVETWENTVQKTTNLLETPSYNLQLLSNFEQTMVKFPSSLSFISGGDEEKIPNAMTVNAFRYLNAETISKHNKMIPLLPALDWTFIIGTLMTLMVVFMSYDVICGEKKCGTLKMVLANPISRIAFFLGKYLGLAVVIVSTLIAGTLLNLTIIVVSGSLPLTGETLSVIMFVILFSILVLSFFLLLGMTVSSLAKRPAVSLVVLLVLWIIGVVLVPGVSWLTSEQLVRIPSNFELQREMLAAENAIWESKPEEAQSLSGDPFEENARLWAEGWKEILAIKQLIRNDAITTQIRQSTLNRSFSSISPSGLMDYSFQKLCLTSIEGFKSFYETVERYQKQLHDFTVEMDKTHQEPKTGHLVYSQGNRSYRRFFSTRSVDLDTVPRWHNLFLPGHLPANREFPLTGLIILLMENLLVATFGFIAFYKYDPR